MEQSTSQTADQSQPLGLSRRIRTREISEILTDRSSRRVYSWTIPVMVLAYAAEVGHFTFSSDYFYVLLRDDDPSSGRLVSEWLQTHLFGGVFPPSLLLMLGLSALVLAANLMMVVAGCSNVLARVLGGCLVALHPFFYENLSYVDTRLAVPLGVLLAVLAAARGHMGSVSAACWGISLLVLSQAAYQSTANFALIALFTWSVTALISGEHELVAILRDLASRLGMVLVAFLAYRLMLGVGQAVGAVDARRILGMVQFPPDLATGLGGIIEHAGVAFEYFTRQTFLFPFQVKIAITGITLVTVLSLLRQYFVGRLSWQIAALSGLLLLCVVIAAHGPTLFLHPSSAFLQYRILSGYAGTTLGIYLIGQAASEQKFRKILNALMVVSVSLLVVQSNIWHQYLFLKNAADMDTARAIADRVRASPDYDPSCALAVVGTALHTGHRYREAFEIPSSRINSGLHKTVYSREWSRDRLLLFYLPFRTPTPSERSRARKTAETMQPWPHPESVRIDGDLAVILLGAEAP